MASLPKPMRVDLHVGPVPYRRPPTAAGLVRRRLLVATTKRLLPLAALALLGSVVMWPELSRIVDHTVQRQTDRLEAKTGQLVDATYHGADQQGRPYTLTASTAHEVVPGRIALSDPKGDIIMSAQSWLMVQGLKGMYLQHEDNLDLSGQVQLYRDDGMVMQTDSANVDFKNGAATGPDKVHVEGPFGTLDAQGFSLVDRGALILFHGPGRMVLNARSR